MSRPCVVIDGGLLGEWAIVDHLFHDKRGGQPLWSVIQGRTGAYAILAGSRDRTVAPTVASLIAGYAAHTALAVAGYLVRLGILLRPVELGTSEEGMSSSDCDPASGGLPPHRPACSVCCTWPSAPS